MGIMHLLGLHSLSEIGNARLTALLSYFGDAAAAWETPGKWPDVLGRGVNYQAVAEEMRGLDLVALYERFLRSDAKLLTLDDPRYPKLLANIPEPPYLLFYRGELPRDGTLTLAMIGSRKATAYGRQAASYLAGGLAKAGAWIVGGLARGIDTCGHKAALDAGGKTIGVLGCGIDVVYPRENRELFEQVAQNGCIFSEYPLGMQPLAKNFPSRNRIISGLSQGVIVVEAGLKSGTQITVDYALEQGRSIYAVPGSIFSPASRGTHRLIKDCGVKPVASPEDVLEDFAGLPGQSVQQTLFAPLSAPDLTPDEKRLLEYLAEQRHFNDIARELGMNTADLAALLTMCELRGFIRRLDGQYYIRNNA